MRTTIIAFLLSFTIYGHSQEKISFQKIGEIQPRHAKDISASPWSVGAETMDRDFIVYKNFREYLGPLGVKKARIQSGWAKTEKKKGVYDWQWLDEIIPDMVAQGVTPWVNISYGNALYADGGGLGLYAKKILPTSSEALKGWKNYVKALVTRYKDYVHEWEVWNEPNGGADPVEYANLLVITAEAVKSIQPEGKILGIALGSGVDYQYADKVLAEVERQGKIHLIDQITHHRHRPVPEENHNEILLEKVMEKYSPHLVARQGEAGCPSGDGEFAMHNLEWSEIKQQKHVLRRMMSDFGRGKETSVFIIMDAKYVQNGRIRWNRKGLLRADDNREVERVKPVYYSVQHVTSIFDSSLVAMDRYPFRANNNRPVSLYGIENQYSRKQIAAVWFDDQIPTDNNDKTSLDFTFYNGNFKTPVYVDLRTGEVFEIPKKQWSKSGSVYEFKNIPVYDSPILIAEKSLLKIKDEKQNK